MKLSAPVSAGWRRWAGLAVTGAVFSGIALAGAPPAAAAEDYLLFSVDGKRFAPTVTEPVFRQSLVYVPGSSASSAIWIRNNSQEAAALSSAAVIVRADPELNGYVGLTAGLKSDVPSRAPLGGQGSCTGLGSSWDVAAGENLKLDFTVDLSAEAPNETMNTAAEFDLVFVLESTAAGTAPREACEALEAMPGGAGSGTGPGDGGNASGTGIVDTGRVAGTGSTGSGPVLAARTASEIPVQALPAETPIEETAPEKALSPAGFLSTVEPIIRSLSGTLLIAMSVALAATVVIRVRSKKS